MRRVMSLALLVAVAATLIVPAGASAGSASRQVLKRVNKIRKRHGLPKLHLSHSLERSAHKYSRYQMRHGYFGHASHIRASGRYRTLGEIIEMHRGYKANVRASVYNWMHSSSHRAIILSRSFRFAGAGRAAGRFHGTRTTIWTMQFGHR